MKSTFVSERILMRKNIIRFVILISIMEIMFAVRIVLEMEDLDVVTFLHQFFWFYFVALWFAASFRIIGGLPLSKIIYAASGAIVIFLPFVAAYFAGVELQLNYYHIETLDKTLFDLSTLLYFHAYNSPMFFELFLLLVGSFLFVYYFTKNFVRSLITAFVAFYGSFLIAGVSWFSVSKNEETLFYIPVTALSPQMVYMFEFLFLSVVMLLIIVLFERANPKKHPDKI